MAGTGVTRRGVEAIEGVGHICAWNGYLRGLLLYSPGNRS